MRKICILIFIQGSLLAQENSGYIYKDSVFQMLPEYKIVIETLYKRQEELKDTYDLVTKMYQMELSESPYYNRTDSVALKLHLAKLYQRVDSMEKFLQNFPTNAEASYKRLKDYLYSNLNTSLANQINSFCKEQNIQFLLDRTAILYCNGCKDYTDELIEFIKK